ncbi:M48 family metalloprotease [Sneathiella sp. P13V-1]|uniref:M48 family metalloprotease n=1 Tax=Sneathiella sp. P13V-1 TaxID=2697366 RepID=UPI00187B8D4C|nr:M48 family metalloprotease [Sneathiella sp. P13V-1]MBE7637078.1 M48 family metalloprotease [Sneathiella sp. P13V-1]
MSTATKLMLSLTLLFGVVGCKTADVVFGDKKVYNHVYQAAEEKPIIETVEKFRVEPLEPTFFTKLVDSFHDQKNPESALNVRVGEYVEKKKQQREAMTRGLTSPVEMHEKVNNILPAKMQGEGVEELKEMARGIIFRLLENWQGTMPSPEIEPVIINSIHYDAKMTDTNALMLNAALLVAVESEDELAGIIAHEIAHTLLNHFDSDTRQEYESKKYALLSVVGSGVMAKEGKQGGAKTLNIVASVSHEMSTTLGLQEWKRDQEVHADLLATDLLYLAGYKWGEISTVLRKLGESEKNSDSQKDKLVAETNNYAWDSEKIQKEFKAAAAKAAFEVDNSLATMLSGNSVMSEEERQALYVKKAGMETHPDFTERQFNLEGYELIHYGNKVYKAIERQDLLQKYARSGSGKTALYRFTEFQRGYEAYLDGKYDLTVKIISSLLSGRNDPNPALREMMYNARIKQGQPKRAMQNLQIAISGGKAPAKLYRKLWSDYRAQGNWQAALKLMDQNPDKISGTAIDHYQLRTELLLDENQINEAQNTVASCQRHFGRKEYACGNAVRAWAEKRQLKKASLTQ